MLSQAALLILGLVLIVLTLRDVFETVVVPGGSKAALHVARRLAFALLPVWKAMRGRRRGLSGSFAPLILVLSFLIWMALLALAFGLMAYALRGSFHPHAASFPDALYLAASGLVTLGLSGTGISGAARWVVIGAGFCGLAVITMAITYLLEVQNSITRRDVGILKLGTSAGEPPSGLALLKTYAELNVSDELRGVLKEGRDWCATVRQSHCAHPTLIYFRSINTGSGWPAAVGALLDFALIIEAAFAEPELRGLATLLREEGTRMSEDLASIVGLRPAPEPAAANEIADLQRQLDNTGYRLKPDVDWRSMLDRRATYSVWVKALADHIGMPGAPLLPLERSGGRG